MEPAGGKRSEGQGVSLAWEGGQAGGLQWSGREAVARGGGRGQLVSREAARSNALLWEMLWEAHEEGGARRELLVATRV